MCSLVGALEHVAQERRADAAALHRGDRGQELAVVQRLRRVVPLEGLGQLGEALDVGSDELLQRLAERLLLARRSSSCAPGGSHTAAPLPSR